MYTKHDKCWNSSNQKVWMSKLKLTIASLGMWFFNQRVWWGQEVRALAKGWEKGGWEREILSLRGPWKIEKHFGAKRMEPLQERDGKWESKVLEVGDSYPLPFPLYNLRRVIPHWSHHIITFKLKNQFYACIAICFLYAICSCQESTRISRCFKRHIIELL